MTRKSNIRLISFSTQNHTKGIPVCRLILKMVLLAIVTKEQCSTNSFQKTNLLLNSRKNIKKSIFHKTICEYERMPNFADHTPSGLSHKLLPKKFRRMMDNSISLSHCNAISSSNCKWNPHNKYLASEFIV